jgi:hypothetical protein
MKYLALIIVAVCFSTIESFAQLAGKMIEYHPAPGQLINTDGAGSYNAANSVVGSIDGLVSLGAFGGYAVYGFDHPIVNDPGNPYGVDFVIFGNVQPDWSEPGIVMVMKDDNGNGKPDDTWYELAGSECFFQTTKHQYSVIYYNPLYSGGDDIPWSASDGSVGSILSNSFHRQDYFPSEQFFDGITQKTEQFTGTLITDEVDLSNPAMVKCYHRRFGYGDNNLKKNNDYSTPDNPYTSEIEGCGGDAMDISWAVNDKGEYVDLNQIDFIKIFTGVLANAGWCGEISTEITGIADVPANPSITGQDKCIVINRPVGKLISNDSLQLEACAFQKGRLWKNQTINWTIDNSAIASLQSNGLLKLKKSGALTVTASLNNDLTCKASLSFNVISPLKLEIVKSSSVLRIDEETEISARILDDTNNQITGLDIGWSVKDSTVVAIEEKNGNHYVRGLSEGNTVVEAFLKKRPEIKSSVTISVLPESSQKEVFITIKDENKTFIPRMKFSVDNFNLNPYVDKANKNYGIDKVPSVTIAHAIVEAFSELGLKDYFRFRDDDKSGSKLYAWKVPVGDSSNVEFIYGYGGYTANPIYSKCWIILLNNNQLINGFDQYQLKNGDEIILYHVTDITSDWNVSCFVPNKSELVVNDTLEVYYTELTCSLSSENKVQVKSSSPVSFQQILVNDQMVYFNGDPVVTDETGTAALRFTEPGLKKIATGIDEMMLTVQQKLTLNTFNNENKVKIWPQPASGFLHISRSSSSPCYLSVIDLMGRVVMADKLYNGNQILLSIEGINPGLYLLQISTDKEISNKKIILQ